MANWPSLKGYLVAVGVVALIVWTKEPIEQLVGSGPPLISFVPASTIAAWFGGRGPGLVSTLLGTLICAYLYQPPAGSLQIASANDQYRLLLFGFEGSMTSILMGGTHTTRQQAQGSPRSGRAGRGECTESIRARDALERSARRMEAMSRRLLSAQEDERRRIAGELHDEIGQSLTALKIHFQQIATKGEDAAARLEESDAILARTLQQVRGMALDLRPSILDDLGLTAALDWYVARHARRTGMDDRFVADPGEIRVHPEIATACFQIVQEALTNVARHARASRICVELPQRHGELKLIVRDDGVGFGLVGMRERVELVGGQIRFTSERAEGTVIQVSLPSTPRFRGLAPDGE